MLYNLTFSIQKNGESVPLTDPAGNEVTKRFEAPTKTETYYLQAVVDFCTAQGRDCRVRTVS